MYFLHPPLRFLLAVLVLALFTSALPATGFARSGSQEHFDFSTSASADLAVPTAALPTADAYALQHLGSYGGFVGTLAISGTLLYTNEGSSGLALYDLQDPLHPARRTRLDVPAQNAITLAGQYAYLVDGFGGLYIVDVHLPSSPAVVGSYVPDVFVTVADVAVQGRFAYIVTHAPVESHINGGTFEILDISQPTHPLLIKRVNIEAGWHISVSGDAAYVVAGGAVLVFDIHVPSNPTIRARYMTDSPVLDLQVLSSYAYLSTPRSIEIVTLPANGQPTLVGRYSLSENPTTVQVTEQRLYVATNQNGMQIIDITNRSDPTLLGRYILSAFSTSLAVLGQLVYLTDGFGFRVVDVADPAHPALRTINHELVDAYRMQLVGDLAYVAGSNGLQIVSLHDEANPQLLSMLVQQAQPIIDLQVVNGFVYIVGEQYLRVVDIHDPLDPLLRGSIAIPGHGRRIHVIGSIAYVAGDTSDAFDEANGMQIIDISNPSQPALVGSYPGAVYDVAVVGTLAYVAAGQAIEIVDVSNPAAPAFQNSSPGIGFSVQVVGETAYITGKGQFQIVNLHDPLHPLLQSSMNTGPTGEVYVIGSLAYVTTYERLLIIDVQNPARPVLRGGVDSTFGNVQLRNDRLYGTRAENGLAFFRLVPLSNRAWLPDL